MKNVFLKITTTFLLFTNIILSFAEASSLRDYFATSSSKSYNNLFIDFGNDILGILTVVGYVLAVCIIFVTGIQFLTANSQKRALLKEKLWLILLGIIVIAGGIPIFRVIVNVISTIFNIT